MSPSTDTLVVGMPGGYTQFVTAVAEVEAIGRASAGDRSSQFDEIAGAHTRPAVQHATPVRWNADAPYAAPSSPPAIGPDVLQADSTSTPVRTAWRIAKHHNTQASPLRLVVRGLSRDS